MIPTAERVLRSLTNAAKAATIPCKASSGTVTPTPSKTAPTAISPSPATAPSTRRLKFVPAWARGAAPSKVVEGRPPPAVQAEQSSAVYPWSQPSWIRAKDSRQRFKLTIRAKQFEPIPKRTGPILAICSRSLLQLFHALRQHFPARPCYRFRQGRQRLIRDVE